MRSKCFVLSIMAMAAASLLFQTVLLKDASAADLKVRVTKTDGRSSSKSSADVADGGTGGFKSGAYIFNSTGFDGIDVGTDVPSNTTHSEGDGADHADVATNTTHGGLTNDPHSVTKAQVGLTDVADILDKLNATIPPTINNDVDEGYLPGSQWFDVTNNKVYACTDNTDGAAKWAKITAGLDEWSFNLVSPKALFDNDTKVYITTLGPKVPYGMVIVNMNCQADADPTTEINANLMYATGGDFIGLTGATVIIAIDSTAGEFSENNNANFNGGSPIPAGAVIYVLIDAAPDVDTTQYGCTVTSYNPED